MAADKHTEYLSCFLRHQPQTALSELVASRRKIKAKSHCGVPEFSANAGGPTGRRKGDTVPNRDKRPVLVLRLQITALNPRASKDLLLSPDGYKLGCHSSLKQRSG